MDAWFLTMTNYDLALCRFLFEKAAELATELRLTKEANHYHSVLSQFEYYALDADSGLAIAAGVPLHESHRHFSHLMAFHPLGLLNFFDPDDKVLIERSILNLEKQGNSAWLGYSYSWLANMYALMGRGEDAAKTLKTFASCYCSPNSFHLNNNQCKNGKDDIGSDPFTLEGNFASAAALQEMMLQSRNGFIRIFPAVPSQWRDVNFNNLLAEGAFLISGSKHEGVVDQFVISAPEGGIAHVVMPFPTFVIAGSEKVLVLTSGRKEIVLQFEKGGMIIVKNGYE
jgi:hypothetical protein